MCNLLVYVANKNEVVFGANVNQNLYRRSFLGERIGFDLGSNCNSLRNRRSQG